MATFYTNVGTNQQSGLNFPGGGLTTQPGTYNDPVLEFGSINKVIATYTMTGNEALSDVINIAYLPAGTLVDPHSWVTGNGIATSASISIGDLDTSLTGTSIASATRYCASTAASSATLDTIFTGGAAAVVPYFLTNDAWVTATFTAMNTPTANKVLTFWLTVAAGRS